MDVIHFPDDARPARWNQPVVALGNFDGVHRGHRKILERAHRVAFERGATPVAVTFDPHPSRVVRLDNSQPLLMTTDQKVESPVDAGVDGGYIVVMANVITLGDPESFVRAVYVDCLRIAKVWVGANRLFGHV